MDECSASAREPAGRRDAVWLAFNFDGQIVSVEDGSNTLIVIQ